MSRRRALAGAIGAALLVAAVAAVATVANLALLGVAQDRGDPVGRLSPRLDLERRGPERSPRPTPAVRSRSEPDADTVGGARSGARRRDD